MLKIALGLSGEEIVDRVSDRFIGVGLLRGEYLCRKINQYVTLDSCRAYIVRYIEHVCSIFRGQPVWYRLIEMEVSEVNTLDGVDHVIEEKTTMMGLRGIRRGCAYQDTLEIELQLMVNIAKDHPNLNILIPFVSHPDEVALVQLILSRLGFGNKIGIMLEIPAAILELEKYLDLGIRDFTLGLNDLSSLTIGAYRGASFYSHHHPAVRQLMKFAREKTRHHDAKLAVAGYIDAATLQFAEEIGVDIGIIHYSKLYALFGQEFARLPQAENLDNIKAMTRANVKAREESIIIERFKLKHIV